MPNETIILQGIPGSGKSQWAYSLLHTRKHGVIVSSDEFMIDDEGNYAFDSAKLRECHKKCLRRFVNYLTEGQKLIIVDNTTTSVAEAAPYYALSEAFGYQVGLVYLRANPDNPLEQGRRNVHRVPEDKILEMHLRVEQFEAHMPSWWKRTTVAYHSGATL